MLPLARLLQKYISNIAVRQASKEILKKYGLTSAKKFFSELTPEVLQTATKKELLDLAENVLAKEAKDVALKNIFSKSNAKKLADILNKGTDIVEQRTRKFLENQSLRVLNQRYVDVLGRAGVDAAGRRIVPKVRRPAYIRARGFASDTLEAALFPSTSAQAFFGAYARGVIGEATTTAMTSVIFATPRAVLAAPRVKTFFRYLQSEVNYLRSVGQVRSASQLSKAIRKASIEARRLYGDQPYFIKSKTAGYISGRLTVPLATTYVFVDRDERKKNIDKFQKSIKPYVKNRARTWVDSYVRADGTRVKGHYRELAAA